MQGKFIVIEGPDGVGKTTIIEGLKKELPDALFIRQPGSTEFGNEMRKILLHKDYKLESMSEALLFFASFIEATHKIIRPALEQGKLVISDRWYHSTLAYQCNHNYQRDKLKNIIYNDIIQPDKTIILMAKRSTINSRKKERDMKKDNFESRSEEYLERVYEFYQYYYSGTKVNVNGSIENNIKNVLKEIKNV